MIDFILWKDKGNFPFLQELQIVCRRRCSLSCFKFIPTGDVRMYLGGQLSHTLSDWVAILNNAKRYYFYSNAFIFGKLVLLYFIYMTMLSQLQF